MVQIVQISRRSGCDPYVKILRNLACAQAADWVVEHWEQAYYITAIAGGCHTLFHRKGM